MPEQTEQTAKKMEKFLLALAETGNISKACKKSGLSRPTAYEHRKTNEAFAAAWAQATEIYLEVLEAEADRRAVQGTLKPIYQRGIKVGTVREFSDTLLIFRLKALAPEKYRERAQVDHSGRVGMVIGIDIVPPGGNS